MDATNLWVPRNDPMTIVRNSVTVCVRVSATYKNHWRINSLVNKNVFTACNVLFPLYIEKDRFQYYWILKILLWYSYLRFSIATMILVMTICEYYNAGNWGRVTYICVSNLTTIGSDNGLPCNDCTKSNDYEYNGTLERVRTASMGSMRQITN